MEALEYLKTSRKHPKLKPLGVSLQISSPQPASDFDRKRAQPGESMCILVSNSVCLARQGLCKAHGGSVPGCFLQTIFPKYLKSLTVTCDKPSFRRELFGTILFVKKVPFGFACRIPRRPGGLLGDPWLPCANPSHLRSYGSAENLKEDPSESKLESTPARKPPYQVHLRTSTRNPSTNKKTIQDKKDAGKTFKQLGLSEAFNPSL